MSNIHEIKKIKEKYAWFVERNQCGLVEKSSNGTWVSPTEEKGFRMYVTKTADPFTGVSTDTHNHLSEESEIPSQFHMGIVYKAISCLLYTSDAADE